MSRPYSDFFSDFSEILSSRNRDNLKTTHDTFRVVACCNSFFPTTFLETTVELVNRPRVCR